MDDYTREISELETQIEAMVEAEDDAKEIAELQMQLEVLRAIYAQASRLYYAGERSGELRESLALRGFGAWTIDNVYAFVYETSVDLPSEGHRSFLGDIQDTDFERALRAS